MSMSPSVPTSYSAPLQSDDRLSAERLRAGLEACGYHCTTALLSGTHSLAPGCTVSLQFGDRIARDAGGETCLTVRCSIRINGSDERVRGMTRWQIRKQVPAPGGIPQLSFAIEADLITGGNVGLADVLAHGGDAYRHLHMLIADASLSLHGLSIDDMHGNDAGDAVLAAVKRIEARFFGDIAAGRSGLVAADHAGDFTHPANVASRHLRMTRVACDWLKDDVLPDLASAIRRMVLQVQATSRYRLPANGATPQTPDNPGEPQSWPRASLTQAATSQGESDVSVTLVPEQIQ